MSTFEEKLAAIEQRYEEERRGIIASGQVIVPDNRAGKMEWCQKKKDGWITHIETPTMVNPLFEKLRKKRYQEISALMKAFA